MRQNSLLYFLGILPMILSSLFSNFPVDMFNPPLPNIAASAKVAYVEPSKDRVELNQEKIMPVSLALMEKNLKQDNLGAAQVSGGTGAAPETARVPSFQPVRRLGAPDPAALEVVDNFTPASTDGKPVWESALRKAAEKYITSTPDESVQVARQIDFVAGDVEGPESMCGPLAAVILRDAGLLPDENTPAGNIHNFWLANPRVDNRPWSLFQKENYQLFRFRTAVSRFEFNSWELMPGDFVYTYAGNLGFEHMFVVTEVDNNKRAFTVTNMIQEDGTFIIQRVMLYDPKDPKAGVLRNEWNNPKLGLTGQVGFDVLRRKGLELPSGERFNYTVEAGDTLEKIARKFNSSIEIITKDNRLEKGINLKQGRKLSVRVNTGQRRSDQGEDPIYATVANEPARVSFDTGEPRSQVALQKALDQKMNQTPSGDWGVYIENLNSGVSASKDADKVFHPASTIKLAIGAAFLHWWDHHPNIKLDNGPMKGERSFEQLLRAMLIKSEEDATAQLQGFLRRQEGFDVQIIIDKWGLEDTTVEPRRSTPADLARLLKMIYSGKLLSDRSTTLFFAILREPSNGDDQRIGGGMPEWARLKLAHKIGTVFEDSWGVVADAGLVEINGRAYVIIILSNHVNWEDFDAAMGLMSSISADTFQSNFPQRQSLKGCAAYDLGEWVPCAQGG